MEINGVSEFNVFICIIPFTLVNLMTSFALDLNQLAYKVIVNRYQALLLSMRTLVTRGY